MIRHFKELNAYQEAHQLALLIYKTTSRFPKEERFAIIDQMRRCSVSITSNIAEGFGRATSKDKISFYTISRGSALELESQSMISKDLGYISEVEFKGIEIRINSVCRLISGLIKSAPAREF